MNKRFRFLGSFIAVMAFVLLAAMAAPNALYAFGFAFANAVLGANTIRLLDGAGGSSLCL